MNCCLANGSEALYYVWDGILEWDGKSQVTVNLLMNRQSPALDIDSYLPYEGKVVIHNRKAKNLNVRIPAWVDKKLVKVKIGSREVPNRWLSRYLLLEVKPKQKITITFPMLTVTETYIVRDFGHRGTTLQSETNYEIVFKGNTAIDISPRDTNAMFPTYLRGHYLADKAPMKEASQYTATKRIEW